MNPNPEERKAQKAEEDIPELPPPKVNEATKPLGDLSHPKSPSTVEPTDNANEKEKDVEAARVTTSTSSITPAPVKVPISKRRGLFGRFSVLAEVEEPQNYPRKIKWYITFVIAMAAVAAPLGSAIILRMIAQYL